MASAAEHPLKKRRLYDPSPPDDPPLVSSPVPPAQPSPPSFSPEEILQKRRNREEIRGVYECYRRIKHCVSQKDPRLMADFEQTYLALISASRGCSSVQRIVAELIPRYASYCPTALEAAVKVSINMYNWSLAIIMRGEDADGIAYQTAKACIFGLVDICRTASSEAPKSSVIQGICSAVFLNVLTFFTLTFEGKDIHEIGGREIIKLQESMESFGNLKQVFEDDAEPDLHKLFNFRALSLLHMFLAFPRNFFEACFELLTSDGADVLPKRAQYFLTQVTTPLSMSDRAVSETEDNATSSTDSILASMNSKEANEAKPTSNDSSTLGNTTLSTDSILASTNSKEVNEAKPPSNDSSTLGKSLLLLRNNFTGMVISMDPSLKGWILSRYKKFRESLSSKALSDLPSFLEKIFGPVSELQEELEYKVNEDDQVDPSKFINHQCPVDQNQLGSVRVHESSTEQSMDGVCSHLGERSMSIKSLESGNREAYCEDANSNNKDILHSQYLSSLAGKQADHRIDDSRSGAPACEIGKNQIHSLHHGMPATSFVSGAASKSLPSGQDSAMQCNFSPNQVLWYFDGDPEAMDVFSASKQLWLGSFGPDASEDLVRMQFEDFGPVDQFLFFRVKDFAVIEYRNIMDAVKAREFMQGSPLWGGCLRVKFLDAGLGSKGAVNGVAVGECCHVYIGKVASKSAKDEILNELMFMGLRNPRMVMDLTSESAIFLEFGNPEESAVAMTHIRRHRREIGGHKSPADKSSTLSICTEDKSALGCQLMVRQIDMSVPEEQLINAFSKYGEVTGWQFMRQSGCCLLTFQSYEAANLAKSHLDGARFGLMSIRVESRSDKPESVSISKISSHAQSSVDSPMDSCRGIISQLSSLFASLCMKYKIDQSSHSFPEFSSNITDRRNGDRAATNTLWIGLPDISHPVLTEDELLTVFNLAAKSSGSVVRITRENLRSYCWLVEFSSVEAAATALKNIRSCPGMFLQIEFSSKIAPYYGEQRFTQHPPRTSVYFPSHAPAGLESKPGPSNPEAPDVYHAAEQTWQHKKFDTEQPMPTQGRPPPSFITHGGSKIPPPVPTFSFVGPVYPTQNSTQNPPMSSCQISPSMMANDNRQFHARPSLPFMPSSITPLSQMSGSSVQWYDQKIPSLPIPAPRPPPSNVQPPLSSSPPPLPPSQPPFNPPPPKSPPPLHESVLATQRTGEPGLHYQWQGALSKSGVHYCTIYAVREVSDICKYTVPVSEPADWPTRLDVTKRTDFRHVKTTFTNTPSHKREVCRLLPSTANDQKGLHDFTTYLRQRECAGVIKIPAGKSMWPRLLFILPYSPETCALLSITPYPAECLIALVLPKETNPEHV